MTDIVFDPYAYDMHEDPYPTYQRLRDEAPVYRNDERDFYALSRHADVMVAFRDDKTFSNKMGVSIDPTAWGSHAASVMSFLAMDDPGHARLRRLVSKGFTPKRVNALEPSIRQMTRDYLEPLIEKGSFDFVDDLAGKVPMDVISEMVGVPRSDRPELRRLSDLLIHREEGVTDVPEEGMRAALELAAYYQELVTARRKNLGDDLVSALLSADMDGDHLTDDEVIGFLFLMVVAGNETTTKLLAHAWYWGHRYPDERSKAIADHARIEDWVEETLRFDTSSQMVARLATTDVALHGTTIPEGARVVLLAGSANRDERAFTNPNVYDFDRDREAGIASFGMGIHFCLGAPLARLEGKLVLEELIKVIGEYDIDESGAKRVHSVNVRGFEHLPTTVKGR